MARVLRLCCGTLVTVMALYVAACFALFPLLTRQPRPRIILADDDPILASFFDSGPSCAKSDAVVSSAETCKTADKDFFFGLATAPAHVEDDLNDSWLEFAKGHDDVKPVRAWHNIPIPEERLRFWTDPKVEIELAREAGSTVFRLGVDWGRIVPEEPLNGISEVLDNEAVEHYKSILKMVHNHDMRVMLTLFHHSLPKWALLYGGWIDPRTVSYFADFARFCKEQFGEYVDYWITFNEPHIFVILTHCSGTWPPGNKPSTLASLLCFTPWGHYGQAMNAITRAHIAAFDALNEGEVKAVVGVAHHVGVIQPYGLLDLPIIYAARLLTEFHWIDDIQDHLDFCGINYYGKEVLSGAGLMLVPDEEYSEAGRGVYPDGLFQVLVAFYDRYRIRKPKLRYIITENGFADARDLIRRPYLLEHLLAVHAAIKQGVPVDGYLQWTISDNWEWADGYCPKFGLVDVDRGHNLTRVPRPSYYLYQQVSKSGVVTREQRDQEWKTLQEEVKKGGMRPFCRVVAQDKRMWAESLDTPVLRLIADKDWRFGKYTPPGFVVLAQRSIEVAGIMLKDIVRLLLGGQPVDVSLPPEIVSGEL
ncbi:hypothetical protein BDL97_13G063200 [Sphagnum fallax]|nr:hypothetical protein BDL97_13G063200 [Sphagnum fallax]